MRVLQDLGAFIVFVLLAYVVYKIGILIEVISERIKGEKEGSSGEKMEAESKHLIRGSDER